MLDKVFMIDRPNEILLSVKIKPDIKRGDTILFADHWRSSGYPSGWRSENRMAIVQKVNKETVWILQVFEDGRVSERQQKIQRNRVLGVKH